jgi:hypothetical protein
MEPHPITQEEFDSLRQEVLELKEGLNALLILWKQAVGIVTFIKWVAAVTAPGFALYLFIRDHIVFK